MHRSKHHTPRALDLRHALLLGSICFGLSFGCAMPEIRQADADADAGGFPLEFRLLAEWSRVNDAGQWQALVIREEGIATSYGFRQKSAVTWQLEGDQFVLATIGPRRPETSSDRYSISVSDTHLELGGSGDFAGTWLRDEEGVGLVRGNAMNEDGMPKGTTAPGLGVARITLIDRNTLGLEKRLSSESMLCPEPHVWCHYDLAYPTAGLELSGDYAAKAEVYVDGRTYQASPQPARVNLTSRHGFGIDVRPTF